MSQHQNHQTNIIVTVNASIGDVERVFASLDDARAWLNDVQIRIRWMEDIELFKLVDGPDKRWGRNGFEHLGWEREPGRGRPQSLKLTLRRAGNYIGKWMSFPDAVDTEYPLDLTGLLVDKRERVRAPFPFKADAGHTGNWTIPGTWTVGKDGYYYTLTPDMMWPMDFKYWEPVSAAGEQLGFTFADNAGLLQAA